MISAIVVAAGSSRRMGQDKLFLSLLGKPVFLYGLELFEAHPLISEIILVTRAETKELFQKEIPKTLSKISQWVEGGKERQHSVWNGLQKMNSKNELVLIHDAARPLVTRAILDATLNAAKETGAAVCGHALADTIKEMGANQIVTRTLERDRLAAVQTPQIFRTALITEAYRNLMETSEILTDDTAVIERFGKKVQVVMCEDLNFKITKPQDLVLAEAVLRSRA